MNIVHLKYAVEVEKTGSISQAAENLFMAQPNLSKAIKELENNLGITIFKRTSKGVKATKKGEEFLSYAKGLLDQMAQIEERYQQTRDDKISFGICTPRASYITHAFTNFINNLDVEQGMDIDFKETGTIDAINSIIDGEEGVGIIRYPVIHEDYFSGLIQNKDIECQSIFEFQYVALMSEEHPMAHKEILDPNDLSDYIEIIHGDTTMPYLSVKENLKENNSQESGRREIYVYERGSQFDILCNVKTSYMWVSPIPEDLLQRNRLVQKSCVAADRTYRDAIIYNKTMKGNKLIDDFLKEINHSIQKLMKKSY